MPDEPSRPARTRRARKAAAETPAEPVDFRQDRKPRTPARLTDAVLASRGMRRVKHTDRYGRLQWRLIPASSPDSDAEKGGLIGPPSLYDLGLPLEQEVALNNELFNRGIITHADARPRMGEIVAAWQAVLRIDAGQIRDLFTKADRVLDSDGAEPLTPDAQEA